MTNDILVTLDNIQLAAGFIQPILDDTRRRLDYIDQGWLTSIRKRLGETDLTIWIEDARCPELQRVNDAAIMKLFADVPGATLRELDKCNQVQLYLRVITIADITHKSGGYIPDHTLTGEWQLGSDLEWPRQPCPLQGSFPTGTLLNDTRYPAGDVASRTTLCVVHVLSVRDSYLPPG